METKRDFDGAKALLVSKGFLGYVTVSLVEALQMVVVFIPAEFIQLSSGMSYPWYAAIVLCDVGVVAGASIIYLLVNVFRFDYTSASNGKRIEKIQKRSKTDNYVVLMYILFIMPIIPFGAICYWAANKKIPYHKYVLTCATGVLPSISTSIIMGAAVKGFIARSMPLWLLVLVIVLAAAALFALLAFVLKKFFFAENKGTPDSFTAVVSMKIVGLIMRLFGRVKVVPNEAFDVEGPYLLLTNHHSAFDFYYGTRIDPDRNFTMVVNKFYFTRPVLGKILKKSGHIPKKMFDSDIGTVKSIFKSIKDGYPVFMCPEGRLSTDGTGSPINLGTASLARKLGVPVVLVRIRGGYFVKPKWRKKIIRNEVNVEVRRIITAKEAKAMTREELHDAITEALCFSEFDVPVSKIGGRKKAEGLENVLYRCPHCGALYSNVSRGNAIVCSGCGAKYEIGNRYEFTGGEYKNLSEYYQAIKRTEAEGVDDLVFDVEVKTEIYDLKSKKTREDEGVFHLDPQKFGYKSTVSDIVFEREIESVEGLAYSAGEEFETYFNDELYYFYPKKERAICARIALVFEILKEKQWARK